ncbi:MAG: 2-dehydropantoate 2-reductase [Clostridia bacterium]|nr:2-dehydropantoate 2-reductase [Clostridia bacterium]
MRILIYGAGAMGTVLGAFLARAGVQADLVTRNLRHVNALNKSGAHIIGAADFTVLVNAYTPDGINGVYDIVFLMTKQSDNSGILAALLPHIAENGVVCTMQNGLPEPSVAEIVGEDRCVGCAVSWGATFIGEGCSKLTTSPKAMQFALGSLYEASKNKLEDVKNILSQAGEVTTEDNFIGARWIKLAINCAFSSLSAMSGLTFGEVARGKLSKRVALEIFNESVAAGRACGIKPEKIQGHDVAALLSYKSKLKKAFTLSLMPTVMKNHSLLQSGMLFDLQKGKKCEIDFINGVAISYGEGASFLTPYNGLAVKIIKEIEVGERKISPENINLFKNLL